MQQALSECPIESAMMMLSGRWPTLILYYLKDGKQRFRDLREANPSVSHRILSMELRKLVGAGVVVRTEFPGYPRHVEYELSASGRALVPLIDAIGDWWEGAQQGTFREAA